MENSSLKNDLAIIDERLAYVKSRFPEEIARQEEELRQHRRKMEQLEQERLDIARETQAQMRAKHLRQQVDLSALTVYLATHMK